MNKTLIAISAGLFVAISISTAALADAHDTDAAKAALLQALASYAPGDPPSEAMTREIDIAAARLEALAGPPDLQADASLADGLWLTLFSSQGVFGEVDLSFMTRALPGGGVNAGSGRIVQVLQELRPAIGMYRNTAFLEVGEDKLPAVHFATAELGISAERSNDITVRFRRIEFAPTSATVSPDALRAALGLPADAPLVHKIPVMEDVPPSTSTVTFLDEELRINRGKDYIAVLRRL
jgi:hypothetical protein